jgi:hypothetical protein
MNILRITPLFLILLCPTALLAGSDLSIEISNPSNQTCSWTVKIETPSGGSNAKYSMDAGKTFQSSASFNNVCEGRYFIHVKDATGKLSLAKIDIETPVSNNVNASTDKEELVNNLMSDFNVTNDLEKKNNIQWLLSRHGVRFDANLKKEISGGETSYSFTMLHPEGAKSTSFDGEIQRLITRFSPDLINISIDQNFKAVAIFKSTTAEKDLLSFLNFIGFDNYKIIGQ